MAIFVLNVCRMHGRIVALVCARSPYMLNKKVGLKFCSWGTDWCLQRIYLRIYSVYKRTRM